MNNYRTKEDYYSREAKKRGFRSRAYFKLKEINQKYKVIRPSDKVLDLGAAPGGWSLYLSRYVENIVAIDLLPMEPIEGVRFIQNDVDTFLNKYTESSFTVILSDMAPNITGISTIDQHNSLNLVNKALAIGEKFGTPNYSIILKVFQSPQVKVLTTLLTTQFKEVKLMKPMSSRKQSSEIYIIGRSRL